MKNTLASLLAAGRSMMVRAASSVMRGSRCRSAPAMLHLRRPAMLDLRRLLRPRRNDRP